jgi:2-oxoisovalerate dehydrogenase E1 component
VLFEARSLYQTSGPVHTGKEVGPIGKARIHRSGKDAVIVTWGTMLNPALQAAETLKGEKREVGVLDLRWLNPLDEATLISAVNTAGGRVVVAHEANRTGGFAAEVLARLHELTGNKILLKTARVATPNVRIPASPVLMRELVPGPEQIAQAVRSLWA